MNPTVVVVGSINIDLVLRVARHPSPGESIASAEPVYLPGGKGANQAVACARQGARVSLIGVVGSDGDSVALDQLRASGVDLSGVRRVSGATGLAVITVAHDGENTVVVAPGANAAADGQLAHTNRDTIATARVCILQGEVPHDCTDEAARIARDAGTRVILNASPVSTFTPATLVAADPLVVNEHEAAAVVEALRSPADAIEVANSLALTKALIALGIPSVVITLGQRGAVGGDATGVWHEPAPKVRAVDTTGAGDGFLGALAAGLARDLDLRASVRHANRVAAYSVQHHGTQASYPYGQENLP